jgi:hypothetical protein
MPASPVLMLGDCLERMGEIGDGSVDLVLCDPPYGTLNGLEKTGIYQAETSWDNAIEPSQFFERLNRCARPNATIILFSQEPYTSRLINNAHGSIPFGYRMVWLKDNFANALIARKAPVNYYEDVVVFTKSFDDMAGHPLQVWFSAELDAAGLTRREAIERWGTNASHFFTDGRQFRVPSSNKLAQMQSDTSRFDRSYDELRAAHLRFHEEQKLRFPKVFNLPEGQKYKSNVLQYRKDYDGFHPTQKPVALLEDLIRTYSNEGDTVLDFTMGSGSTGVAALKCGRQFIGIEREPKYFGIAQSRMAGVANAGPLFEAAE